MTKKNKLKVAVDFDNTLIKKIKYPSIKYELLPYAKEAIRDMSRLGVEFILHTARTGWFRIPSILFIKFNNLPIKTPIFNKKIKADLYIDDSNLYCKRIDWKEIKQELLKELEKKGE